MQIFQSRNCFIRIPALMRELHIRKLRFNLEVLILDLLMKTIRPYLKIMVIIQDFKAKIHFKAPIKTLALFLFFTLPSIGLSQVKEVSLAQAIRLATENNSGLKASAQRTELGKSLLGSAYGLNKLELFYNNDQNNIAPNGYPLEVWGINQSIEFPSIYGANKNVMKGKEQLLKDQYIIDKYLQLDDLKMSFLYNMEYCILPQQPLQWGQCGGNVHGKYLGTNGVQLDN